MKKMENFWPSLRGSKRGQHRQVSLYANDIKTSQSTKTTYNLQIQTMQNIQFQLFTQIQLTPSFTEQFQAWQGHLKKITHYNCLKSGPHYT
jgi:hypothetical protein